MMALLFPCDCIEGHPKYLTEFYAMLLGKVDGAQVVIDDGDENVLAKQKIAYTEFPLDEITLLAC
jgi:hypothetical protein